MKLPLAPILVFCLLNLSHVLCIVVEQKENDPVLSLDTEEQKENNDSRDKRNGYDHHYAETGLQTPREGRHLK